MERGFSKKNRNGYMFGQEVDFEYLELPFLE